MDPQTFVDKTEFNFIPQAVIENCLDTRTYRCTDIKMMAVNNTNPKMKKNTTHYIYGT